MSGLIPTPALALAGCGSVGGAFAELAATNGPDLSIECVLVRDLGKPRGPGVARLRFTDEPERLLATDAGVVVEALGGVDLPLRLARATLERGASFVTANKALVAAHGPRLAALAQRAGGDLRFDAAVGGGVPIVRTLRSTFAGVPVRRIEGVLNGTANYLLTRFEEGADRQGALADAQGAGYAEADPARDLDGRDVADKVAVLAWVIWGVPPEALRLDREGLPPDAPERARAAAKSGRRLRLIADIVPDGRGGADAEVRCREVPADSPIGRTRGVENTVRIETSCGEYTLSGPGAGGPPTALAVWADVRAAVAGRSRRGPGSPA